MTLLSANASSSPPQAERPFTVVGIGASAGGLDAFRRLLSALPPRTGMAYVLVQHLDPNHESILTALLAQVTQMVVSEVDGDVLVEPNHVYVIPPACDLILVDGTLKRIARGLPGSAHLPIDSLLVTLAKAQGRKAIGVILSGMGTDGTLGLAAIKANGGIAFVQEPSTAKHAEMPHSALSAGGADLVLSPEEIAQELARLGEHPYLLGPKAARPDSEADAALATILDELKKASGTNFSSYKQATLRRRIARRMAVARVDTLAKYADYLTQHPKERDTLFDDCLISVTSFFRDPDVFRTLAGQIAPALKGRTTDAPLRIWVPGCATGEEVYSIAICLLEGSPELPSNPALQIFATDLNEGALARAREGSYLVNVARDVSPERLARFFVKQGDRYQIGKSVREMCIFARHDLTRDPPYSHLDLISCRNVLIYLEPALQERVLATFHYALRPGGLLLLGAAETATAAGGSFAALDEPHRLYSRNAGRSPSGLLSGQREASPTWTAFERPVRRATRASEVARETDRLILARFGPPAVVVDDRLNVLEFRGDTDPFLDHGQGRASLNLERLLRQGVLIALREAVAELRTTGAAARRTGLRVRNREGLANVSIEVIPLRSRVAREACLLILFDASAAAVLEPLVPTLPLPREARDREVERLNDGLERATDYVHTLLREHETAVAELQASTEDALSSNEELQSLNEELQTAKEEIQSTNEELATLNHELHDRNAQLARFNDEIQRGLDSANAMVDTVPLSLLILDYELRVERANMAFHAAFHVTPAQIAGCLLVELCNGQWDQPQLLERLKDLTKRGGLVRDVIVEAKFPELGERILSLNARQICTERGAHNRVLLAIEDRTEVVLASRRQRELVALEQEARQRAETADHLKDQFVATVSHELRGPLSVISGWVDVLTVDNRDQGGAVPTRALAAIRRGVNAQKRLISELLDHSRLVMGKIVLERTTIDLVAIVETTLVGVRAAAEAKDIQISFEHESPTSFMRGDADRMQQLVWNLILNAIKFTPPNGRVHISIGRALNQVELTVTDTGIGISAEFLPHVFERFRQAESSSSRSAHGLGLGLKLVRGLVELHGGTVHAQSPGLGAGSTFVVVLPVPAVILELLEVDTASVPYAPERHSSEPPESMSFLGRDLLAGRRLLVVDDEQDACDALVGLLERCGAHVRSAATVDAAMVALHAEVPDVLISDLGLAVADGYELIRRVRLLPAESGGQVPALAVSAYTKETHRRSALEAGFQRYLEKPVTPSALMSELVRLAPAHPRSAPLAT